MKTEAEDDKSIHLRKSSIKLETSTPRKLFEEDTIVNQSSSASGSDNEDEFYSQTSNTEDSFSNLSLLEVRNELDTNYGPHKDLNNKWKFGNSHIDFDQDKIQVGGQIWALTPVLMHTEETISLMVKSKEQKHTNISILFKEEKQKKSPESVLHAPKANYLGGGTMQLNPHKPNYIYWDDPNELVDRLRLLIASQAAEDYNGNPIKGGFYEEELSKASHPDTYLVEKVLKTKGEKVLVKWLGFSNNHNSWISKDEIL
ncbi:hypothetical protein EVAR_91075_1 [Eumeta japonica]|uniref:Chromo domain-containing protein n=1 Tax=Eumeta variegata TaxID=151549 RepID=A0A4C1SPL8_EUMVA|nr:hypothetical protein EVAR_91075_1 [Eumeta japonica]